MGTPHRASVSVAMAGAAAALAICLAACGATSGATVTSGARGGTGGGGRSTHGTANVAYAGSLEKLYETVLGPAFAHATGDTFGGPPGAGSVALAQEIASGEISPGLFLSVGAKPIKSLWPSRAHFSLELATDPLVVAYSPDSRYAAQLDAIASGKAPLSDLFSLFERPGFRLGRTDPNQDPQGQYFELMMRLAQQVLKLPAGTADHILGTSRTNSTGSQSQIFSETALPTMIATGNVDAGSAFLPEALQYHLRYVALPSLLDFADPKQATAYATVSMKLSDGTVVTGSPISLDAALVLPGSSAAPPAADRNAAASFLAFLLSTKGRSLLHQGGYTLQEPVLELAPGTATAARALPAPVLSAYDRLGGALASP